MKHSDLPPKMAKGADAKQFLTFIGLFFVVMIGAFASSGSPEPRTATTATTARSPVSGNAVKVAEADLESDLEKRRVLGQIANIAPKLLLIRCAGSETATVDEMYNCFDEALNKMDEAQLPSSVSTLCQSGGFCRRYWTQDECTRRRNRIQGAVCIFK
jgi:hypothetical protein